MALRRYRMAGTASSTTAAVDSMRVQRNGTIKQIILSVLINSIVDNGTAQIEISRASTADIGATGGGAAALTQSICEAAWSSNFVTSGLSQPAGNVQFDCNDPVSIGDPLYIHINIGGTTAATVDVIIVIDER